MENMSNLSEEELRKIAKEEMAKSIMNNLDSTLIFTYIKNLEEENRQLKFDCKQAEELKHFFMTEKEHELEQRKFWRNSYYNLKDKIQNKIEELENIEQEDVDYSRIEFGKLVLEEVLREE